MLQMISYTNGNSDLIEFGYYPPSWIKKYLGNGQITRHPKLSTVFQFWFKTPKSGDTPDIYKLEGVYVGHEQAQIIVAS